MTDLVQPPIDETEISWKELIFGQSNTLWFFVMAIAFVLFELGAPPALVAVAVCSKFGTGDVLNAFWLRRTDPVRRRGKVCFWFCISQGLWKTSMVALAAMVLFILVTTMLAARPAGPPAGFVGTALTFLFAFILASLTTVLGAILARVAGVMVWIDGTLSDSRRNNEFPPRQGVENRVRWLLAGGLILPVVVFLMLAIAVAGAQPGALQNAFGLLVGLFLLPMGIIAGGLIVARAVVASTWRECWGLQPRSRGLSLEDLAAAEGIVDPTNPTG